MTNTTDNVGALYKALRQKGFSDIGTEDIFRNKLQDENNRKQLYDALSKNGYDDIGDYDTFNTRVGSSYQSASPVQEVDSNYTAGQVDVGDMNGDVPEYLQRPEEQEAIKGFVPAFKQGSDALYQGMKSSVGETANLLAGSSRDYTKAQRQLQELVDSGYDLTGFDKEKALKDYKDRQFQRDMDSWEEMMQQRRKEREGMGFLDALVHKFKDPDRPRDQYDSSAVAFNKMKVGDEVQLGRAFDAIQEALTQANGDVEKAYALLGEQSAKETWGDKTSREAREAMREFKPTEGTAAWVGNIVPQMIGNVAGIAASVSPWTRWLARPLGVANLGMLTASSSGSAMADAREYAEQTGKQVSEGDVLRVGAISGAIEAGTEMLPYGRFFGGIHNSVAKKLGKEVTNAIAGNPTARRELSSLLRDAGSELSTKLFTKEAGKRFIGDVSIEGFSEFLAEGGGTLVPMIYQNREDYPTLYEVLQNGWEGAKAGIFMGSILGGASSTIGHYQNRARRKQQGKVMLADTKEGVLEVVGQTGEDKYMAVDGEGMPHEITRDMVNDFEVVDFQEFDTYCKAQTEENLQKAVENGRSLAEDMDRTKKHAAKLELDKASRGLTPEMIEEMDGVSPTDYLASHEDVAEQVLPYLNAKAKYEGLIQGVREGIDGKIEQSNTYIDKNTHTDGRIYSARLKVDDEPVSIVSGDVALDENGLIDKERSAGRFIVMNSKGELQMRDRDDILSVDGISDAHEMKLTTAETIRQQEAQRAADEIEGKREFVQGEEVETYLNGMRVLVGVQAQNEDGTITVTDGKNEILTTREELQKGVDIVEQMRIDEELAAEQQGNDLASSDGMEDAYALNTELSFQTENGVVRGSVTNERNADGLIEVWTEEPLNGKKVNLFTEEELKGLLNSTNSQDIEGVSSFFEKIGRNLSDEEAVQALKQMQNNAVTAPLLELTAKNWVVEFGEDGIVETPIGKVKMGENQYLKLLQKERESEFGMIKPTLVSPDFVIEHADPQEGAERNSKYLFVKTFIRDGKKYINFESVTVRKDSKEVVISSHRLEDRQVKKKLKEGILLWNRFDFGSDSSGVNQDLSSSTILNPNDGEPGSNSQSNISSDGKYSNSLDSAQEVVRETIPIDERGNLLYHKVPVDVTIDALYSEELEPEEIDAFVAANKDTSAKLLKSLQDKAPKMGTNIAKYKESKLAWQEKVADAQEQMNYWDNVGKDIAATRVQPGDKTAEAIMSMGEPLSGEEFAAMMLGTGNLPILYDSYKKETGGRNAEARGMIGLFANKANGGMSIEEAGEKLMLADEENGTNFFDQTDPNAGRNAIIDVLSGARTRGDLFNYIKENRIRMAERERQAEYASYEQWCAVNFKMTPEEYEAYEEVIARELAGRALSDADYQEFISNFIDELINQENETNEANEQSRIDGIRKEGSGVLQREESIQTGRIGRSVEGTAETVGGIDSENGVVSESLSKGEIEPVDIASLQEDIEISEGEKQVFINKNALKRKLKESLSPNGSDLHLAENQKDLPDLLPAQGDNDSRISSEGKDIEVQEEKQIASQETIAKAENQKVLPDLLPAQEDRETETGNSGTGIDYTGSYTLSGVLSDNGERFYQDINGNINLVQIPLNVFEAIHKEPAPFRLIPSMLSHVFDRHGKEMKLQNAADAIKFVLDVMNNFDHVRQGESKALIFSVENGRNRIGQRAITVLLDSKNGEYYGIKTSGYERLDGLRKRALLWEKGANETSTTDVASVNVTTAKAQQGNELSGSASNQSNALSDNKNSEFQEEKQISSQETIAKAEQEVDSSPSEAQKEAGNYRKGHVKIDGFDITIENPKGSVRSGVDGDGKPWSVTMNNTYGYIRGTEGVDGDHIDIFLGEHMEAPNVYVVDQVKQDGSFDEHKVMYGFNSALAAKRAYLKNYSAGWKGLGNITGVSKEVFREWIDSSHRKTKPFNEYKSVRDAVQSEVTQRAEQTEAVVASNESETKDAGIFTVEDVNAIKNNPLTVEEIEGAAVEPELKTLAKDYLAGNESFINLVAYQNIYNDVRNRTRGIEPNSTGASETQLDEVINGNQGGLESGFGRGEVDNVGAEGSETPVSRRRRSGKTGTEQPTLFDGERSDHEVRGEEPAVDGVSPGRGYSDGSGSAGGNGRDVSRPARGKTGSRGTKNDTGRRTNAGHERVDAVDKSSVSVDADLQSALDDFKDILHQFGKAGKNDMSLSLVGLNKEQIQLLPRLVSSGVKLGYQLIRKEVYDFKKWAEQMRSFIGDPLKQAIGYSDTDVNAFIREMWNSKFEIDGEVHTLAEWSAKLGTKELKRQVSATLEEKRAQQMAAESIPVKIADAQNIDETLPYLLPQQREDVRLAEVQFFDESHQDREHGHGKGYLFTNGTGTGKTYTGLGIVKRFIKQGKNRILVVTPSQPKVTDWMKDATNLGIELRDLDTLSKEKGTTATTEKGEGAVITTFANLRQNKALLEDTFDLIVYDESHRIMENKQGEATIGADVHFMITNRNTNDALRRYSVINPKYQAWQKAQELYKKEMESSRLLMQHAGNNEIGAKGDDYAKRLEDAKAAMQSAEKEWEEEEKRLKPLVDNAVKTTKTVFLSATPFNTRESLSYTEGYIFSYPKENTNTVGSYHHHSPQTEFYLTHFGAGYKFRYGRLERGLTNADALVKQEIAFSDYLENELGTKSGRIIDSEYDYSRDFPMVTLKRAQDINDAIECVWREDALSPLSDALRQVWFNYNYTSALLETMKISATIPRIREHLKMGRKVVVFHRRVQSKAALNPPFKTMLSIAREQMRSESNAEAKKKLQDAITLFEKRHEGLLQYEQTLDYSMPREQIAEAFGAENVLFFSGKESGKTKNKAVETFNDDDSGKNIIVIQEASGKEGISLHDTSGKHQRVLITLALPQSPITALQIEGRIYRIGNKSNAIFEYPLLGLDSEMILFGQQFNQQVSTTENLALGSKARDLRSSFTRGVEEHTNVPLEQQGFGGKEFDKGKMEMADPFEDAVLDYYGNQKVKGRRDNREGMDYFATPEPVGFKMVEWAMPQEGETALEPSAGHGAIARYVSRDVSLTAIEPSSSLFGKLQLKAGGMGRKFVNDLFENYAVQNKHDVIVMNPPFGAAGKKAMDHLEKAFDHLTEGGRVVALIPHGQMDKRFEKWYGEKKEAVVTAEINLPSCTFEQAGTSVYARIVVIDRIGREETRRKAPYRRNIDLSGIKTVKELFERLKDVEVPGRTIDEVARNMKNAKKTVKEFKEIKGVDVVVDTDGVFAYSRSGMTLFSQRFDSESMANIPNEYARMHYWIEANGTVDMGNRTKERIEVYVTGMKTLRNLTGKTHEQLMEESKDGKSVLPAENTMRTGATSEQQRSGDKYSYKEDRNTKTGEVMHLAIPLSKDLDRGLYLQMVACAKRNDGYWNRFKKAFHFQTKEGADRFIKESATIGEDGNMRFRLPDSDGVKGNPAVEQAEIRAEVEELADTLHTPIRIVRDTDEISDGNKGLEKRKKQSKGWFDSETGEVVLVLPNAKSVEDARATVFHEVVAHKGLRGLLGKEFAPFLDRTYKDLSESVRREVVELSKKHGWDLRVGMEEYMARLAERGFADRESSSVWNKIKNAFMDAVHRLKIELGFRLRDNDLRYILWKSYQNLKGGNGILQQAQDIAFQMELGVGRFRKETDSVFTLGSKTDDAGNKFYEDGDGNIDLWTLPNDLFIEIGRQSAPIRLTEYNINHIIERHGKQIGSTEKEVINFIGAIFDSYTDIRKDGRTLFVTVENRETGKAALIRLFPSKYGDYYNVETAGYYQNSHLKKKELLWNESEPRNVATEPTDTLTGLSHKSAGNAIDTVSQNNSSSANVENKTDNTKSNEENIRFRDGDSSSGEAMREYEGAVKTNLYKFQEAYQDSMLGLLKLQESVVNETKTDLADNENAYMAENQLSSKNAYEMEFYKDRFFKPMMDAVKGFIKHGRSYEDVKEYMMAKSGLERNEVFAMRDAQRKMDERMKELETLLDINAISEEEYEEMRAMAEEQRDLDYAENRERDYSGLSSLMADTEQYEEMAQELVDNFEEGNEKAVAELWKRVNDATKSTLLKTYKSGMMTKGVYDHVKGMFEYYIPMRGWTEDVAADVYDYILSERSPFNAPVKAAQGRTSLADDPLATIGNMAESAIMQGNRNMMKQKFLNLVENHPTSLATVQKVWYENMGTKEEPVWEQSFPDIPENANADEVAVAIEEHEARMKELKKNGMAKDERNGVNLKYRASKREMNEHIVVVKRGGREYAVYVNGNPRAAQAINGLTNPDTIEHKGVKLVQRLNRQLAANFTTRNPAFVLSNLSRDLIFSTTAVAVKEKGKYARRFNANIAKNTLGMVKLMKRNQDGKLDMGKERDRLFKEFLENGGETGYTALHSVDEYKKLIDREVMDAKGKVDLGRVFGLKPGKVTTSTTLGIVPAFQFMSKWTEFGNRCAEDVSRFTAYMTSRQEGRSVQRSIADAKEITVNFNKKGAGGYGATTFKSLYLFFNAGVQSLNNFYRLAKANPKKFNSALLGFTAAGVLLPMLNEFLIDMWGDDDDKDKYDNLPEWVRRNNFCFWLGDDRFVTIPLPIELRAFYGMGEIFNQWTKGNMKHKNVGYELVNQITELIPLNPLGGNGDMVSSFVPDAGKPFYQVMTNKDYFGKPIYKETDFNVLMPEFTKAYKGTSSALVASSELLNEVTGGDKYTRGWANVNPAKVEHVFEGYFGGMGKTINQLGKTIGMIWDEDQRVMRNVPVVNRFLNGTDDRNAFSRVNEEYYHYLEEFRETEQRLKGYEKEADLGIMEYAEKVNFLEYSKEYQRYEIFKDYQKELKELQTEIKEAVGKDEKRFLENQLNFVKMELVERLNEMED